MNFLGEEGYVRLAAQIRDTTRQLREGIEAIPELRVWGDPVMSVFSFGSELIDVAAVGDVMDEQGWHLDRQTGPDALHLMVSPAHAKIADAFLEDLRYAAAHHGKSQVAEDFPEVERFKQLKRDDGYNTPAFVARHLLEIAFDPAKRPKEVAVQIPDEKPE